MLAIVRGRRAKLGLIITELGVEADVAWKVLRLCGLKREISWEDAVEEAEAVIKCLNKMVAENNDTPELEVATQFWRRLSIDIQRSRQGI